MNCLISAPVTSSGDSSKLVALCAHRGQMIARPYYKTAHDEFQLAMFETHRPLQVHFHWSSRPQLALSANERSAATDVDGYSVQRGATPFQLGRELKREPYPLSSFDEFPFHNIGVVQCGGQLSE